MITPLTINPPRYEYYQSSYVSQYHHTGRQARISPYVYNYTSNPAERSLSAETSYSRSANVSLTSAEFSKINGQIGYTYGISRSFTDTFKVIVPSNYKSWVEFYPIVYKTSGTLKSYYDGINATTRSVTSYYSRSGAYGLDGVYLLKEGRI